MTVEYIETDVGPPPVDFLRDCPGGDIRGLVFWPDKQLEQVSEPVEAFDEELSRLVVDMATTMYMTGGKGLAAIQVGVPKRVFIVDIFADEPLTKEMPGSQLLVAVNPVIVPVEGSKKVKHPEGCLSLPSVRKPIERYEQVILTGWTRKGERFHMACGGTLSRVVQHENDHLNGELFLERMTPMNRKEALRETKKFQKGVKNDTIRVKPRRRGTEQRGR